MIGVARKWVIAAIGLMVLVGLAWVPTRVPVADDFTPRYEANLVLPVYAGSPIRQEFVATGKTIQFVRIHVVNPPRKSVGALHLSVSHLQSGQSVQLGSAALPAHLLRRNTVHQYRFRKMPPLRFGERVALELDAETPADDPIQVSATRFIAGPDSLLQVAGAPVAGTLRFEVLYWQPTRALLTVSSLAWQRVTIFLGSIGKALLIAGFIFGFACFAKLAVQRDDTD